MINCINWTIYCWKQNHIGFGLSPKVEKRIWEINEYAGAVVIDHDQSQEWCTLYTHSLYILQMLKEMQRQVEDGLSIYHPVHSLVFPSFSFTYFSTGIFFKSF